MNDISKQHKQWKAEWDSADQRLKGLGGRLDWSPVAYEIMRWVHPDLTLIFYAHRTTAGNHHARVRAGRCTNRDLLRKCIFALAENTCTFQFPTEQKWHGEAVTQAIRENRPLTP
jgi:hypothetical protein